MSTVDSGKWSTEDIRRLLDSMRKSVPNSKKNKTWSVALKTFDWTKVAFKHFTPEECDAKWKEIMQKLRKIKTLNELIVDAQNAVNDAKMELPKKPLSANALFFAENKERFKKRNPGVKSREMMKFVNDTFKKLPSEKKEKYLQKAKKAKEEYQDNIKKMTVHSECERKMKAQKRITHPMNGYNLFCREQKSLLTGVPQKEITSTWSKRWRALSKEERENYSRRCLQMKTEMSKDFVKKGKQRFPGEPRMPTRSVYIYFIKHQMKNLKEEVKGARDRFAIASHRSKNLSQQEKEQYQTMIDNAFSIYKEQLQRWFETLTPNQQEEYCDCNPSKVKYLRYQRQLKTLHQTSDSEDEDLEESSDSDDDDDDDDDDDIIEVVIDDEEVEIPMFDLF